jgi:hypothetical protein
MVSKQGECYETPKKKFLQHLLAMASIEHECLFATFDDSNYQTWFTCCMEMFLHQKEQYYGHVNNAIIRPTNPIN